MYEYINGTITDTGTDYAVADVGGIGYLIYCSTNTLNRLVTGQTAKLYIHMHVAEDLMQLYGFYTQDEREMFRKLISVSRIGKKIALSCLSVMTPSDIAMAVKTDNAAAFDNVFGMGRKTAQRIILELKEKVQASVSTEDNPSEKINGMRSNAIDALIALGYDGLTAGKCVGEISDNDFNTVEELIKKALAVVSGRG